MDLLNLINVFLSVVMLYYIECCHRKMGLPFEDRAVFNIALISLEVGIKHKESLGL